MSSASPKSDKGKNTLTDSKKQGVKYVQKYMKHRDVPGWFRGTSNFQVQAANKLFESLFFDLEQHSAHRVRSCLIILGLNPMIPNSYIKTLIRLSRGNDLAFLWFLWELHYKTNSVNYSVNEQLILSSIAHLDMITTLRELDRLLPPPTLPKTPEAHYKTGYKTSNKHNTVNTIKNWNKTPYKNSAYFDPINIPEPYNKRSVLKRPYLNISMGDYKLWSDPSYIVQNESNRWFVDYKLSAAKRVVHNILQEEIGNIFDNYDEWKDKADNANIVCEYHKRIQEMEARLKLTLEIIARDRCLKYFDIDGINKEKTQAKIKNQMDRDVEMFVQKFRDYAGRIPLCTKKERCWFAVHSCKCPCPNKTTPSSNTKKNDNKRHVVSKNNQFTKQENPQNKCNKNKSIYNNDDDDEENSNTENNTQHINNSASIKKDINCSKFFNIMDESDCDIRDVKSGQNNNVKTKQNISMKETVQCDTFEDNLSTTSSKVFFKSAQKNKPWHFDYHKIFNIKHPFVEDEVNVKQEFVKAIDSELSFNTKIEGKTKPNIDKALNKCVKRMWTNEVIQYNIDHPNPCVGPSDEEIVPLQFDRDTFDPDDIMYMRHMLYVCFEHMKKNKKFVLATLPDAYKLPAFFYFVQNRFGKRYTPQERRNIFQKSLNVLRALEKLTKRVPLPKIKDIFKSPYVSYACRDYLLAKSKRVRSDYYNVLDEMIMHQARIFWFAMRPYLASSGPPRNTYFAYMPSRNVDITRFRQWKPYEYMDAKGAWDGRQREKRM